MAQTTCKECGEREITEGVGRNSSSSCVTIGMYQNDKCRNYENCFLKI